jgi:hypothetical protein
MAGLLMSLAAPVSATTLLRAGLEELTATSSTVIVGEVTDTYSYWNSEGTFILTDVTIAPIELAKGKAPERDLTVTILGGTVGDLTTVIVGGAQLAPGKSYVLFLDREDLPGARKALTVRGHSQGVFEIVADEEGFRAVSQARDHLLPDHRGLNEAPGGERGLPLEDLLSTIRTLTNQKEDGR